MFQLPTLFDNYTLLLIHNNMMRHNLPFALVQSCFFCPLLPSFALEDVHIQLLIPQKKSEQSNQATVKQRQV